MDEIRIETLDSGETDSFEKPNVFDDYTSLSNYRVFPSEKQFFRFEIEACHDAFILLSASIDLKSQDFYEICIGGSSNQITFLRRKYNDFNQLKISTPNILGCTEKSTFEIRWTLDGTIYLVKESAVGTETIIDWTDSIPLLIQGVGIMTGWGSDGIWIIESSKYILAVVMIVEGIIEIIRKFVQRLQNLLNHQENPAAQQDDKP
ncbi:uncharacterized protein [Mytilus edulis]|uniref:uncharacterized protein n=1 Tax=Mytilus edulis TaxID=6550 RepID=UPI0039EF6046